MRAVELLLLATPLLVFILWRVAVARGVDGPAPVQLVLIAVALLVLGGALAWFAREDRLPQGVYVPPHWENGRIVPGHTQ